MEENQALRLLRILRRNAKGGTLTHAQLCKLSGMDQADLDIAAEQLEAEGMLSIERTYTLAEE
jgi:DNA-binding IclR family transcriptional regulator